MKPSSGASPSIRGFGAVTSAIKRAPSMRLPDRRVRALAGALLVALALCSLVGAALAAALPGTDAPTISHASTSAGTRRRETPTLKHTSTSARSSHKPAKVPRAGRVSAAVPHRVAEQTSDTVPVASLSVPVISGDDTCTTCLPSNAIVFLQSVNESVTVTVTVTLPSGETIPKRGILLQWAPVGTSSSGPVGTYVSGSCLPAGSWCPLNSVSFSTTTPYTGALAYQSFPSFPGLEGDYDLRAAVTDSSGQTGYSPVVPVVVDADQSSVDNPPHPTYVGLQGLPRAVSGNVKLLAAPEHDGDIAIVPSSLSFQISPAGAGEWSTIGSAVEPELDGAGNPVTDSNGEPQFTTTLNTTLLANGAYDLQVADQSPSDSQYMFVSNIITVVVDNTPPTVTLENPGTSLSGVQTLSAAAAASGVAIASVSFQEAPSGSGAWSTIGLVTSAPYTYGFDTRNLKNGRYDLRAVATDMAGNTATSVVTGVSIDNPTATAAAPSFTITDTVVPATGQGTGSPISLLGEIAGSPDHETWAYGYTTAPPATVNGSTLPYTAAPGTQQLVLLRHTDESGWDIADVLRCADGTAFTVSSDANVYGQMTRSGEAWVLVHQQSSILQGSSACLQGSSTFVFHREPGGQFLLDPAATEALQPVLGSGSLQLQLGQSGDGAVYGVLLNPNQNTGSMSIWYQGSTVPINTKLSYGELVNGSWTVQSASIPPNYVPVGNDTLTLESASPTGPGSGWGVLGDDQPTNTTPEPLLLGSFGPSGWQYVSDTGLDALDLTGSFALGNPLQVQAQAILAASDGVWIQATLAGDSARSTGTIVALYDPAGGRVVASWCSSGILAESQGCANTLGAAMVPDAVFDTSQGPVGLGLGKGNVDVYAAGAWKTVPAPGFDRGVAAAPGGVNDGTEVFTDPTDGWLAGDDSMGEITAQAVGAQAPRGQLVQWPQANESTLVSVALPPAGAGIGTSGALAVGLEGSALHYDSSAGWVVDPVPRRAQNVNLLAVAYDGTSNAVAVGSAGTILDWNGTSWSADPQSTSLTQNQFNAVAFAPDGQGWAVGTYGTILHFDGTAWSAEQIDGPDTGVDVSSVAVAGNQPYAVAGGNLITRQRNGSWQRVDSSLLPTNIQPGSLALVSGLPDGGLIAAGNSVLLLKQSGSASFQNSPQPIEGNVVALAAFRDPGSGLLRAFVSVAPSANLGIYTQVAGFPSGDGDLLVQTGDGWEDLSRAQYPQTGGLNLPEDGVPQPDPVLAVAAASDGSAAWAVGGYAGTLTASGVGLDEPLQARPLAWQTASIWRYDAAGSAMPPTLSPAPVILPAQSGVVSFAFFSGAECISECAEVQDAQPDVNLQGAATEIAAFAQQPGGPAFAMLGGNAVGPLDHTDWGAGTGAVDLANLQSLLAPLGSVPLYAAYGPLDAVPTSADPAQPWDDAFAQSPGPFGLGDVPAGISSVGSGGQDGSVNHYYSYDVTQNQGTLEVIVLDNSAGSLDASEPGQAAWLKAQLAAAQAAALPVVVVCAQPLDSDLAGVGSVPGSATDASSVAAELAAAGVLAVFTTSPSQSDQEHMVPYDAPPGAPQIPEYEGAALGYQQTQNNGVLWYFVSVDTTAGTLQVQGIPVVQSLALEPLDGISATQSSTLSFRAVGQRPPGTIPSVAEEQSGAQGFANYVAIPSSSCSSCIAPSYSFTSSNTAVGNFVAPSAPGSQFPKLNASDRPIASSSSGLFCAFNAGQTTVSVTSGLLSASLTVTVQPGNIGAPCGSVPDIATEHVITVQSPPIVTHSTGSTPNPNLTGVPSSSPIVVAATLPHISLPPPPLVAPLPASKPTPLRHPPPVITPPGPSVPPVVAAVESPPPVAVPPIPTAITPVPPGGATASAQATARREEKARKHASQSAYTIRPAGSSSEEWFYPAVGVISVLAVWLVAAGVRPGPRPKLVLLEARVTDDDPRQRRQRRF